MRIALALSFLLACLHAAPARAVPVFDAKWGASGEAEGRFDTPLGIAVDGGDTVYVADTWNHRIQAFDADGAFGVMWGWGVGGSGNFQLCHGSCQEGDPGSGGGQLDAPFGVAADPDGRVYVVDSGNDRIQRFGSPNQGHPYDRQWGGEGTGLGQFNNPARIAIDAAGNAYVSDTGNHRVQKFRPEGTGYVFEAQWGALCDVAAQGQDNCDGKFNHPRGIAVDSGGDVYVADAANYRIQKFHSDGTLIARWGSYCDVDREGDDGCDGRFGAPYGLDVGPDGTVYVADTGNHRIQSFAANGELRDRFGGYCDVALEGANGCDGLLNDPFAVAVASDGDVYVADTGNFRVQRFREPSPVDVAPPAPPAAAPQPSAVPASPPSPVSGRTTFSEACNLEIAIPRLGSGKRKQMRVSTGKARRLFTHGVKGTLSWGTVGGKEVVCRRVKMAIVEQRGRSFYIPGTRTRVPKTMLTEKAFPTSGARFLKKRKVGKLRQRMRPAKRITKIGFKSFNRRSRLGRRALSNLRRRGYIGRFLVLCGAEIDGTAVLERIGLSSRARAR